MIIYYSVPTGDVLDLTDGFIPRRAQLDATTDYLIVPDNSLIYQFSRERMRVVNGSIQVDGFNYFTLAGLKAYYRELLEQMFNAKINFFGLMQFWKVQLLRQKFDNGDSISYPTSFYRLDTGIEIEVGSDAELQVIEDYFLNQGLAHLDSRITQYASYKQQIESAVTIQEITAIKFM